MTNKKREWLQIKWKEADQKARKLWTTNKKDQAAFWYAKADEFKKEIASSIWFRIVPGWIGLIDNSVRFGYREEFSSAAQEN